MRIVDFLNIAIQDGEIFQEFKKYFDIVLPWEGGSKLHNVNGDSGGWTKFGIAYNKNKQYFDNLPDFNDTTYEEAVSFAYVMYYKPLYPNYLPKETRLYAFDTAYNLGIGKCIQYIQLCIGVKADGVIGAVTRSQMKNLKESCLRKQRLAWYNKLALTHSMAKFLKGWLNRSKAIYNYEQCN